MRNPESCLRAQKTSIFLRIHAHIIHTIHNFIQTKCYFGIFTGGVSSHHSPQLILFPLFFSSSLSFSLPKKKEEKKRENQSPSCKTAISNTSTLPFPFVSSPINSPNPLNAPGSTNPTTSHSWPEISCDSTCST